MAQEPIKRLERRLAFFGIEEKMSKPKSKKLKCLTCDKEFKGATAERRTCPRCTGIYTLTAAPRGMNYGKTISDGKVK